MRLPRRAPRIRPMRSASSGLSPPSTYGTRAMSGFGAGERKGLVAQRGLDDHATGDVGVDAIVGDEIAAVGHDGVGVLHDLEPLVMVGLGDAHALADDLQHVDDAERPVALVRAQLAMIGM